MYTVEFHTKIKDGIIEIPEKYRKNLTANVRVILLSEDTEEPTVDIIDELMKSPLKASEFKPLKREEIYDRIR